jgi:Flp pilus assembly protein TadD
MPAAANVTPDIELARALIGEQRADEALCLLQTRLAQHPARPELLRSLAAAQAALGRTRSRLSSAEAARAAAPQALEPALELADALEAVGRRTEADAQLARLVEAYPADPRPRSAQARLAERRHRPDLAETHWQRVLALRPDDLPARIGVSRALRTQGRFAEAEDYCRILLALHPGEAGPLQELARIALEAGEPLVSEVLWRRALVVSKRAPEAQLGLAQALAAQHRFAAARAILEQLDRVQPGRPEALAPLARTLLAEGDLDGADAVLLRLIEREPGRLEHRLARGRVLEQRWVYPAAAALYAELKVQWPESAAVRLAIADLLISREYT